MKAGRAAAIVFVSLAIVASACSSSGKSTSATNRSTTTISPAPATAPPARSAGCRSPAGPANAGTVTVGGATRRYLLALPANPNKPAPVVVDLHGLNEAAEVQATYSGMARAGSTRGFIVATPASDNPANSWTLPPLGRKDADFIGAILDQLEATRCVDTAREVVDGISNGAGLAIGLPCALQGRLAAVFPVAGINILRPCPSAKPTNIIAFHGSTDPVIPYEGGAPFSGVPSGAAGVPNRFETARRLFSRIKLGTVPDAVAGWANVFGCSVPSDRSVGSDVRLRVFPHCTNGVTVQLYTIDGGGHTWPGANFSPSYLGHTTHTISATQIILDAVAKLR